MRTTSVSGVVIRTLADDIAWKTGKPASANLSDFSRESPCGLGEQARCFGLNSFIGEAPRKTAEAAVLPGTGRTGQKFAAQQQTISPKAWGRGSEIFRDWYYR